jgi:hypothetical protein
MGRLLGTITRTLEVEERIVEEHKGKNKNKHKHQKRGPFHFKFQTSLPPVVTTSQPKKKQLQICMAAARREANLECERGLLMTNCSVEDVAQRAQEIIQEWGEELQTTSTTTTATTASVTSTSTRSGGGGGGWDKNGSVPVQNSKDDSYIPVSNLIQWIDYASNNHKNNKNNKNNNNWTIRDPLEGKYVSWHQDAARIPTDTYSVLQACHSLSVPCAALWNTPLLICYPLVTLEQEEIMMSTTTSRQDEEPPRKKAKASSSKRPNVVGGVYKIQMGIYAHRLLPEAMTLRELQIVMSALDAGSYKLTQPLQQMPRPISNNTTTTTTQQQQQQSVFESSPYPIVCLQDQNLLQTTATTTTTTGQAEDEGVSIMTGEPSSLLGEGTSRDEGRISAFTPQGLLKLLENTGCDVSNWDTTIQSKMKLKLMLHQEHAISWMLQMESLGGFGINSLFWEEREFWDGGKYYLAPALGQLRLDKPPQMWGGLLCDEMGLGKTIQVLGLILATLDDQRQRAKQDPRQERTHTTLIIVPPALVAQWQNEIFKVTGGGNALTVDFLDVQTAKMHPIRGPSSSSPSPSSSRTIRKADICLTTYQALEHPAASQVLASQIWGRIVLDEMQEIRSSTTKIAKACEQLECDCRWMLSGTPLFEGIDDLRGELNFLRLAPFGAKTEDGFFNFCIAKPWQEHDTHAIDMLKVLSLVLLRRSKSMTIRDTGMPILGLKPLIVEFVAVPQSVPERALYYFLESVVARELRSNDAAGANERKSRTACLRLLREMCISAVSDL